MDAILVGSPDASVLEIEIQSESNALPPFAFVCSENYDVTRNLFTSKLSPLLIALNKDASNISQNFLCPNPLCRQEWAKS